MALAATGFQLGQLAILGGALGVGLGFGLQNIVANFVSGLILAFERPVSVGDIVQLAGLTGEVRQIGIRASHIHTFDGAEVIVPNSELISGEVINWTRADRLRRIEVRVGVAYGSEPRQILKLLIAAAEGHEEVAARPAPDAMFVAFGESSLDFALRFWGDFERSALIQSGVAVAVNDALVAAGISVPFPQRDLHLKSTDLVPLRGPTPTRSGSGRTMTGYRSSPVHHRPRETRACRRHRFAALYRATHVEARAGRHDLHHLREQRRCGGDRPVRS